MRPLGSKMVPLRPAKSKLMAGFLKGKAVPCTRRSYSSTNSSIATRYVAGTSPKFPSKLRWRTVRSDRFETESSLWTLQSSNQTRCVNVCSEHHRWSWVRCCYGANLQFFNCFGVLRLRFLDTKGLISESHPSMTTTGVSTLGGVPTPPGGGSFPPSDSTATDAWTSPGRLSMSSLRPTSSSGRGSSSTATRTAIVSNTVPFISHEMHMELLWCENCSRCACFGCYRQEALEADYKNRNAEESESGSVGSAVFCLDCGQSTDNSQKGSTTSSGYSADPGVGGFTERTRKRYKE